MMSRAGSRSMGPGGDLSAVLAERIATHPHRLLALDYDGTLAPLLIERRFAHLSPEMLEALTSVCASPGTRVAILSGRPLSELLLLLAGLPVYLVGEHGWEEWPPQAPRRTHPLELEVAERLAIAAARWARYEPMLEHKRCSLALHTRGLEDAEAARLEAEAAEEVRNLALPGQLNLDHVLGGLELRASSRDKGTALRELMDACPPGTLVIAMGDDKGDEKLFREVDGCGISIHVGDGPPLGSAGWRIPTVDGVAEFLRQFVSFAQDQARRA